MLVVPEDDGMVFSCIKPKGKGWCLDKDGSRSVLQANAQRPPTRQRSYGDSEWCQSYVKRPAP